MTSTSEASPQISDALRAATATAHERAERSPFVDDLMSGRLDVAAYRRLAEQLFFVYQALESVGDDLAEHDVVRAVADEKLRRTARLRHDLGALGVGVDDLTALPATRRYVEAITATATEPARWVAHHYTRYLGDLSGGQVIRSRMKLHYGIPDDALSFYVFDGIDKLKRYKDAYRERLNTLSLDDASVRGMLDEAVAAFGYNEALFAALETSVRAD